MIHLASFLLIFLVNLYPSLGNSLRFSDDKEIFAIKMIGSLKVQCGELARSTKNKAYEQKILSRDKKIVLIKWSLIKWEYLLHYLFICLFMF